MRFEKYVLQVDLAISCLFVFISDSGSIDKNVNKKYIIKFYTIEGKMNRNYTERKKETFIDQPVARCQ